MLTSTYMYNYLIFFFFNFRRPGHARCRQCFGVHQSAVRVLAANIAASRDLGTEHSSLLLFLHRFLSDRMGFHRELSHGTGLGPDTDQGRTHGLAVRKVWHCFRFLTPPLRRYVHYFYRFYVILRIINYYGTLRRYSFTVFSNILVYVVTWIVLRSNNANKTQFGPSERKEFQVSVGGTRIRSKSFPTIGCGHRFVFIIVECRYIGSGVARKIFGGWRFTLSTRINFLLFNSLCIPILLYT